MNINATGAFVAAMILVLNIFPPEAKAYIDPGTGSLMLQYISGGLLLALMSLKTSISHLRGWLKTSPKTELKTPLKPLFKPLKGRSR